MDFTTILTDNFVLVVFIACLIAGYIIKTSISFIPNKYIPSILAVLGACINTVINGGVSVEVMVYGALMGLSSTGMHQAFKSFIEGKREEKSK